MKYVFKDCPKSAKTNQTRSKKTQEKEQRVSRLFNYLRSFQGVPRNKQEYSNVQECHAKRSQSHH